jgi:pilus assembly protein Flp/PilA
MKLSNPNLPTFSWRKADIPHRELPEVTVEATLRRSLIKFFADESGATAIEYGLIAAGISLAIIAIVNGLGTNLNDKFTSINSSLK